MTGDGTGATPESDADIVVAQGTFDILHPGHLHYLRDAKAMGDRLVVIVARSTNVTHKASPVVPGPQRREMVAGLDPVDEARLGHPEDIFAPIEELDPAVIALGYDQHHDAEAIRAALADRGIDCAVRRASAHEPDYEGLLSSGRIVDRILDERG
ncbi:adenylyltransferase/cytidyltransferase family protein [Halosimplex litoreum]|uniref:FAD synthase n=1 Tax=Halosimplex litoreum TaxID=1198301 RepID=A0A7T3KW83_9EURY|nr:adenylyltransferase/cytidyltransferase family protein [Halosimplex litoreum]QPV63778.1 adenylyltransferase/cytidyltransferase family protein [Halosimplex litoreum]